MGQNSQETWNILEILNDIKNLNGSRNVLNFLNLFVFEWFEYVELCGKVRTEKKSGIIIIIIIINKGFLWAEHMCECIQHSHNNPIRRIFQ